MRPNDLLLLNLREKRGRFTIEASSLTDNADQRVLKFLCAINAYQATKLAHIQRRNDGQGRCIVYCCRGFIGCSLLGTFNLGCDECVLGACLALLRPFLFPANEANVELLSKPFAARHLQGLMAPSINTIVTLASNEGRNNKGQSCVELAPV